MRNLHGQKSLPSSSCTCVLSIWSKDEHRAVICSGNKKGMSIRVLGREGNEVSQRTTVGRPGMLCNLPKVLALLWQGIDVPVGREAQLAQLARRGGPHRKWLPRSRIRRSTGRDEVVTHVVNVVFASSLCALLEADGAIDLGELGWRRTGGRRSGAAALTRRVDDASDTGDTFLRTYRPAIVAPDAVRAFDACPHG